MRNHGGMVNFIGSTRRLRRDQILFAVMLDHLLAVGALLQQREAHLDPLFQISASDALGQPRRSSGCSPYGHRDQARREHQQIERVRAFQHVLVSRGNELEIHQTTGFRMVHVELRLQHFGIAVFEVVFRLLDFVLVIDLTISDVVVPLELINALRRFANTSKSTPNRR